MLWEIDIHPSPGQKDRLAVGVAASARDLHLAGGLQVSAASGYLLQGTLSADEARRAARELLADGVVERTVVAPIGDPALTKLADEAAHQRPPTLVHVLPKPGVMDPVAESTTRALTDMGLAVRAVRTLRKFWLSGLSDAQLRTLCSKVLANDAIEQVVIGPLKLNRLDIGSEYTFQLVTVPLRSLADDELVQLSRRQQLSLSLAEMRTIRDHFASLSRDPTDVELETIAQTWSEHCSHKTLKGRIAYHDERGPRQFKNMLQETIFAATVEVRKKLGSDDWCVSVFEDNAGVVRFDSEHNAVFKVETHNHPSAIEPYGGANTGLGGVIRDTLGTGLGARPVANTDVFCFAPPDLPADGLPQGVLHPRRVMTGVAAGVRDYGNRMGIPTVNGAIYFDERYLGNPLVFCGNVGILPRDKSKKNARAGDLIVAIGGRTGRDGIHGATFSSIELTHESETVSGGAVQIGNAITEKMLLDVVLAARDRGLFTAITDCGAGGFSSAVGEMGERIGAEVQLDRVPLKYHGLSYTEIWISEAQERMVLAVPPDKWEAFTALAAAEGVEATALGRFVPTGRLKLKYGDHEVADLSMKFLHDGRPPVVREAVYTPPPVRPLAPPEKSDYTPDLLAILGTYNVASKEWVIRQYDHEVQGGSVIKPLVGAKRDGPGDAAVFRPVLSSRRGLVVACGLNPRYGDLDPYAMAAGAIDEAVRNCVAVGADPARIALLDNFCWGNTDRPERLGPLVRAALACYDVATKLGTPFISGKDSLNNEFRYVVPATGDATGILPVRGATVGATGILPVPSGETRTIAIPGTLLISALGQIEDVSRAVTMDLKEAGSAIVLVGLTKNELGGSHFAMVQKLDGGHVPRADASYARRVFAAMHAAIDAGLVRACHDLSEGGLAVAAAEMAFAGGLGAKLDLSHVPQESGYRLPAEKGPPLPAASLLFSESQTRFLCEVGHDTLPHFAQVLGDVPHAVIGEATATGRLQIAAPGAPGAPSKGSSPPLVIDAPIDALKEAWQSPLRW